MTQVRCPICADEFTWPQTTMIFVYNEVTSSYDPIDTARMPPGRQAQMMVNGYQRCPHPSGDMAEHYLPATYAYYPDPLVVGLIGASSAGKTHLLTAMIREAYRGGLTPYGLQTSALDFRRHNAFQSLFVKPLEDGDALPGTDNGVTEAADILLVRSANGQERPITFFDVAGEDLESTHALNPATRFLAAANAMIFVHGLEDPPEPGQAMPKDPSWSFELAVERLKGVPGSTERIPVAIAVTKADRLRYVPPIDRWVRHRDEHGLNAARLRAESRDVYAFLHHRGAAGSLRPFGAFRRCTLHFVSASGGDAVAADGNAARFVRGIHPVNVLQPLIAILAMSGMILGPEAERVGLP
jgi:double-GTPase-like protein